MVHQGPVLKFSDPSTISWTANTAGDEDQDLIPNGLETTSLALADSDSDGISNEYDFDIDNDGLSNWYDDDDDGDGTLDIHDTDANADETLDLSQTLGDLYFSRPFRFYCTAGDSGCSG